jgi:hypothetical protein
MARKAAMDIISRHHLLGADRALPGPACRADSTRRHGGNDDRPADPPLHGLGRSDDFPRDLVTERERKLVTGTDSVEQEPEVGVAQAAAHDAHDDLALTRLEACHLAPNEGLAQGAHFPSEPGRRSR